MIVYYIKPRHQTDNISTVQVRGYTGGQKSCEAMEETALTGGVKRLIIII